MKILPGFVKIRRKVQNHEVADGYDNKVARGQNLVFRRFLECLSTSETFYVPF